MALDSEYMEIKWGEDGNPCDATFNYKDDFNFAYDVVDVIAKRTPDKESIVYRDVHGSKKYISFSEVSKKSDIAAGILSMRGIKKGDRVMLIMKRRYQYWYLVMALHKLGAVCIPTSHMVTGEDIADRVEAADIKAIVCAADKEICESVKVAKKVSGRDFLMFTGDATYEGFEYLWDKEDSVDSEFDRVETSVDDPMLLYFTSGTTGKPKAVMHKYTYPLAHIMTAKYWHGCVDGGRHFTIADSGWAKSAWGKLYGQWFCECAIVVYDYDTFIAREILDIIQEERITSFCAPPTIYNYLLRVNIEEYDLSSVREYVTGGEAMPREIIEAFKKRTGFDIREGFGQTETALLTANYTYTKNLSDGIGYASPLYDMIVVDEEDNELLAGEVGEIAIRFKGDGKIPIGIFYTYLADEERYRTVTRHGIYHTGDKGYRDASGGFHFKSRNDDVIKTSGYRVGPTEVEDVIIRHEAVGEVAVTGFPDIKRGQAIKASIILKDGYVDDGKLAGEIREFVRVHAASYKIPRIIEFVAELPRTTTGKVNRAAIRMRDCKKMTKSCESSP